MAFDARTEDFQRLGLCFASKLDAADPFGAVRSLTEFGQRYAQNRDSLPQTDADRAFHLVARAAELIDYRLPFAEDNAAPGIIESARKLLVEAVALDPTCHDAHRMLAAADNPSFEDYYRFLVDGAESVRTASEVARDMVDLGDEDANEMGRSLAMRPYERWLASLAARALECGHYRKGVDAALRLLELDPEDQADVRYTLALAYAKLEDAEGLAHLVRGDTCGKHPDNPWYALARMALAYKARDFDRAHNEARTLLAGYPGAARTLARQDWLPDGVFSRIVVRPHSEDELILAVSESTVLLQEGCDSREKGALGSWVMALPKVAVAKTDDDAETAASGAGKPASGGPSEEGGRA